MHLVQELSGLTIKRSKTGYILGQGASVMLVEADNGNVSETLRYNQHVWKGMVFMGQETSYVGPLLFEQLWKSVIPFTLGQTLPTGGLLTPKLTSEMYDNPYLQQHPPDTIERDPASDGEPRVEVKAAPKQTRKRGVSTTGATAPRKKPRVANTPMFGCTPKQMRDLKAKAVAKGDKDIFITGYITYDGEKLTDKSELLESPVQKHVDEPEDTVEDIVEDTPIGAFQISAKDYGAIEAEIQLEDERRIYEEGIEECYRNSLVFDMF
jgi:hypothetical protein